MTTLQSSTEATREIISRMYDAIVRGDFPEVMGLLADDIVVHEPAYLPYGGVYRGMEEFRSLIGKAMQHLDVAKVRIDRLIVDGDRGIGILRIPTLAGGEEAVIAEESLVRDGRISEMRIYFHGTQGLHRT